MKIVHSADWHVRERSSEVSERVLGEFVHRVSEIRPDVVVLAADLLDHHRPSPTEYRVLFEAIDALSEMVGLVIISTGGHEVITTKDATALSPLKNRRGNVVVCETPTLVRLHGTVAYVDDLEDEDLLSGFRTRDPSLCPSGPDMLAFIVIPWLKDRQTLDDTDTFFFSLQAWGMLLKDAGYTTALVGHFTVMGAGMSEYMVATSKEAVVTLDTIDNGEAWDHVMLGHLHKRQRLGQRVDYCGSINRMSFAEEGQEKGFLVHDTNEHPPAPPSFVSIAGATTFATLDYKTLLSASEVSELPQLFIDADKRRVTGMCPSPDVMQIIWQKIKEMGLVIRNDVDVESVSVEPVQPAEDGQGVTLHDRLRVFCEENSIEEIVVPEILLRSDQLVEEAKEI